MPRSRATARSSTAIARPRPLPARPPELSPDGTTALLVYPIKPEGDSDALVDATDDIREAVTTDTPGLEVAVTGPAGFSRDAISVFESIDGTLLIATLALVFVLLILIYRSPIFWLIPFFSVVFAEVVARALAVGARGGRA